jgi:hypothetical protein
MGCAPLQRLTTLCASTMRPSRVMATLVARLLWPLPTSQLTMGALLQKLTLVEWTAAACAWQL